MNIQSSFYRSVNDIERAPRSNLAGFTLPKESHGTGVHEGHSTAAVERLSSVAVCHCFARGLLHVMYP